MANEPTRPRDDRDLYCLECGYNLRGLSGDPRRCPECGHDNPLNDIELPAGLIKAQLRKMETAQTGCVFAAAGVGLFSWLGVYFARTGVGEDDLDKQVLCWAAAVGSLLAWMAAAGLFRAYCDRQKAWTRALWGYHWRSAVVIAVIVLLACPQTGEYLWSLLPAGGRSCAAVVLLFGTVTGAGGLWVRSWARRELEPLQRRVAVKFAWQQLGRDIERNARRGPE